MSEDASLFGLAGKRILIDTCVGNHKSRKARPKWDMMNTPYLDRLKAAGVTPDQIDMVMCTHLHVDHVGWNTRLDNGRWVPTFKNAKYVWSQEDFDFYKQLDADPEKGPANGGSFRDSVLPVVDAGLVKMVKGAAEIEDGLKIVPSPGHTPGTIRIEFESKGEKAVFCGDILHHAVQIYNPDWNSFACLDAANARKSRRATIEDIVANRLMDAEAKARGIRVAVDPDEAYVGEALEHRERVDEVAGRREVAVRLLGDRVGDPAEGHERLREERVHEELERRRRRAGRGMAEGGGGDRRFQADDDHGGGEAGAGDADGFRPGKGEGTGRDGAAAGGVENPIAQHLVEGLVRVALFIGYLMVIARAPDVRRVFQYHGAEHKAINAYEAGLPLDIAHVRQQTLIHPRCGTSFLLVVVVLLLLVLVLVVVWQMRRIF